MSVEENGDITHPGPILRAAREELKLTVDQVAEALHLRSAVVLLIESESYEEFSSDVFLKGYFRSYCRLVNLHEERMIELLDKQLAHIANERKQEMQGQADELARTKRAQLLKLGSVAVVIVVVCAVFVYLTTKDGSSSLESVSGSGAGSELASEQSSEGLDSSEDSYIEPETEEYVQDFETSEPAAEESELSIEAKTADDQAGENEEESIEIDVEKPSVADLVELGEIEAKTEEKPGGIEAATTESVPATLFIEFTDECWFEAYDANELRIGGGLKKAGDEFRYNGDLPVRVVLGNGNVANIEVDGEGYDFASSIRRSGRAEIVIGQEAE
jgi:cytoskeleton protein RodZ